LLGISGMLSYLGTADGSSSTSIVTDIHTDQNTKKVLQVATGPMVALVVVWIKDDGTLDLAVGPNYSWYEFTKPMSDRLTDEKWREMLKKAPPKLPSWMEPLYTPK